MIAFDLAARRRDLGQLEAQAAEPDFWADPGAAQEHHRRIRRLQERIEPWERLRQRAQELLDLIALAQEDLSSPPRRTKEQTDSGLEPEVERELKEIEQELERRRVALLLDGEYDGSNAYLSINAGAGGTEAQDWADMLLRMYLRWAEDQGFETEILQITPGEEAGIKSVTVRLRGPFAYGFLRAEVGVHRLVRLSPYDAAHRRHTSFASVDVLPELEETVEIEVRPEDLKIETYRSSGAGGQHVNKTDSAVRITHLPTGIVVSCQNERSQHRNRDTAMAVLRARLFELERQKREAEKAALRGEQAAIAWGSQIRSYVLHPYTMVKDLRTNRETSDTQGVLNGQIQPFIRAFLEHQAMVRMSSEELRVS